MRKYVFEKHFFCENIFDENIFCENIFDKNIFGENVFDKNIFGENIFDKNIFGGIIFDKNNFWQKYFWSSLLTAHSPLPNIQPPPLLTPLSVIFEVECDKRTKSRTGRTQ